MAEFDLKIVTPRGQFFSGKAQALNLPAVTGRMSVWAHHANLVTSLEKGKVTVTTAEGVRTAQLDGGMLSVMNNTVTLLTPTFRWEE